MFKAGNYGMFATYLEDYMDIDGYVPEIGDDMDDFRYDSLVEWDYDEWEQFVVEAASAKYDADEALKKWRDEEES